MKKAVVVSVYEYLPSESLNVLEFTEMTDEWLDFIVNCRRGTSHDYDIVIGAMAYDQVFNYINDYVDGILTKEQFWVLAKFKKPTINNLDYIKEIKQETKENFVKTEVGRHQEAYKSDMLLFRKCPQMLEIH